MDVFLKIWKIIGVVLIGIISFLFLFVFIVQHRAVQNANYDYLPSNTIWAIKIDPNELSSRGFSDLYKDDEAFLKELRNLIVHLEKNYDEDSTEYLTGVLFTSDVYVFTFPFKGRIIQGVLYNLYSERKFKSYYSKFDEVVFASNNDVGLVLSNPLFYDSDFKSELQIKADQIIAKKANRGRYITFKEEEGLVLSSWFDKRNTYDALRPDMSLRFNESEIKFETKNPDQFGLKPIEGLTLKPNGFHFSVNMTSPNMKIFVNNLSYEVYGVPMESPIKFISFNYRGAEFESNGNMALDADILISFESSTTITELHEFMSAKVPVTLSGNELNFGILSLYVEQKDDKTFLIKGKEGSEPVFQKSTALLKMKGNPSAFFELKGNSMIKTWLHSMKSYNDSKKMMQTLTDIDIDMYVNADGTLILKGRLKGVENKSLLLELMRVAMTLVDY